MPEIQGYLKQLHVWSQLESAGVGGKAGPPQSSPSPYWPLLSLEQLQLAQAASQASGLHRDSATAQQPVLNSDTLI